MLARDDGRLKRKYAGKLPDEIEEETGFDVSGHPIWFQKIWTTDFSKLTDAERAWRRKNKWDRGTLAEPNPLPAGARTDDEELQPEYFVSDEARRLWHQRVWSMTRNEFEEAWSCARDPKVIGHFLITEEQERRETALLISRADDSEHEALRLEIDERLDAVRAMAPDALAELIARLTAEQEAAEAAARAKLAAWRRRNEKIEQEAHAQHEEPQADPTSAQQQQAKAAPVIQWVRVSDLAGKRIPKRQWLVEGLIPDRNVTNLTGDGGTGKSLLALQLAVGVASTGRWLNMQVEAKAPVIVYSAEDEMDETHRRLTDICYAEGIELSDLGDLLVAPLAGMDAMLSSFHYKTGAMQPSAQFVELYRKADAIRPKLVVLDTQADVFAGDESKRKEVRQFVGLLRGLTFDFDCAVVLLSHPSVSGMMDGTGRSGSTGWNNAFRSRLYFDRSDTDPDLRILKNNELNYGQMGAEIRVRWDDGVFVREQSGSASPSDTSKEAERAFLDCLAMFESQGRDVSPKSGVNYAPKQFEKLPQAKGCTKRQLADAMERLLAAKVIRFAVDRRVPSKPRWWLTTKPDPVDPDHDPDTGEVYETGAESPLEAAKRFLRTFLADGPRTASEVSAHSLDGLISDKTLRRAATQIGVKSAKQGAVWMWSLPS
jgi:RecA-family ATPase